MKGLQDKTPASRVPFWENRTWIGTDSLLLFLITNDTTFASTAEKTSEFGLGATRWVSWQAGPDWALEGVLYDTPLLSFLGYGGFFTACSGA